MTSLEQHHSPTPSAAAASLQADPNSQPNPSIPHQPITARRLDKDVLMRWFGLLSNFIMWPVLWPFRRFMKNEKKRENYAALNDLESTLSNLQSDEARDISFLKSVESMLSNVIQAAIKYNNKGWDGLMDKIVTLRTTLTDFHQSLERNTISQIPEDVKHALSSFCSHLKVVILTQRQLVYEQNHIITFFRRERPTSLLKTETCKREMMLSLDTLNVLITSPKVICETRLPVDSQETTLVDISPAATPRRYRFVDCALFTQSHTLRVEEFLELPREGYTVISYVWRGKSALHGAEDGRLTVKGAEHADPISIEVLNHACTASLKQNFPYIWMDRLCIIQSSKEDKNWQISQMFKVYQSSSLCLVLAGGMQRLVPLDEETTWIHRGWTLQEVLAPANVLVLFSWGLGPGQGQASVGVGGIGLVEEVIAQRSATASLSLVLDACTIGYLSFTGDAVGAGRSVMVKATIFSDFENHSFNDPPFWQPQRKVLAPNVTALAYILSMDQVADFEAKSYAIWKSALMRTSSRPVDMVFSIMGLFGVILDTGAFDKSDRLGATIALATEILKKGGSATWLGASFQMDPSPQLSTFSTFPQTSVSGKALVLTKDGLRQVSHLMDSDYPYGEALVYMPHGSMDTDGYFHFSRKAIRVVPATEEQQHHLEGAKKPYDQASNPALVRAMDKSVWEVQNESDDGDDESHSHRSGTRTYMLLLGWFNEYYPGGTSAHDADNIRAMLVEEHAPEKYNLRSFVFLARQSKKWTLGWKECAFAVGGPLGRHQVKGNERREKQDQQQHEVVVAEDRLPFPTSRQSGVTLKDEVTRKSRWAVGQGVLEQHYLVSQDK